jgi:hypothetical protein
MKNKNEPMSKPIRIRITQTMFRRLCENLVDETQSDFIRKSITNELRNNCRTEINEVKSPKRHQSIDNDGYREDFNYNTEKERTILNVNTNQSLFKNQVLPDLYIINYGGSIFELYPFDKTTIRKFIYDELGFEDDKKINYTAPLVGLLHTYARFYMNQYNVEHYKDDY